MLAIMFLIVGSVSAITVGQRVTQEQLDSIDTTTVDLEPTFSVFDLIGRNVYRLYTILFIRPIRGSSDYEVIEIPGKVRTLPYEDYTICKTIYTQQECVNYFKMNSDIAMSKRHDVLRNNIAKFKTQVEDPTISELG